MAGSTEGQTADTGPGEGMRERIEAGLRAGIFRISPELAPRVRAFLALRARALLAPRAEALVAARADADAVRASLLLAERSSAAAVARLDRSPLSAATTVHAAHARHPGVTGVFARHGLPRCLDCAVGVDETLAEAASGEGFPLEMLLGELNALLACR
ncbi:MAG: hypothetical protein Q8P18_18935 [Pseudomonadota bacterium]|nr:hypothetical protein [Pseudomonadota bacterium]